MDLSTISIPDTAKIHLEFPGVGKLYSDDEKTKPVVIEVYGPASNQAVDYRRKLMRETQANIGKKGMRGISIGDPEEREIERLCALTASVRNLSYNGEAISAGTIVKVYRDPKMGWVRDQVAEKLGSWEDFLA